jgi:hypothetical protein
LRLQLFCFRLNADSFFHTETQAIILLLSGLRCAALVSILVFARATWLEPHGPKDIAPTFAAAPYARFIFPRVSNGPEHGAAFVADLAGEASVLRKMLVAFLDG